MNDFLKNLRGPQRKDSIPPRKNVDGNYYNQADRRSMRDRRTITNLDNIDIFQQLGNAIPEILENTTTLTEQIKKLTTTNQLLAEAKIQMHNAIKDFFDTLNKMASEDTNISEGSGRKVTTSYAAGTHYTKDEILSIIQKMRNQGATFTAIADHLQNKGMPTFSGKGEWHAQTIHRLCK
ncbi:MAG: hypothetical protein GY710_01140 [Desulfobacteraceae bacterium]|nr:hypothetical protein [Desulfobacteraceae bacterium]